MDASRIASSIKAAGFRATRPRIAFLSALARATEPLSIADVGSTLKKEKIDTVTLYRIAESFEHAGLIARIDLRQGKVLYEFIGGEHHHHIICTDCGTIEDVETCLPDKLTAAVVEKSRTFTSINSHALEFFGTCKECSYA